MQVPYCLDPKVSQEKIFKELRRELGEVLRELARQRESEIEEGHILQPKKKPKGKSLSDLDKSINQWHSSLRVRNY